MSTIPLNVTRKELAIIVRLSAEQIRKSEKRIGLDKARVRFNNHLVMYRTCEALHIFYVRGFDLDINVLSFLEQHSLLAHFRPLPTKDAALTARIDQASAQSVGRGSTQC